MELLLNLFWLLLAVVSFAAWGMQWPRRGGVRGHRRELLYGAVGLTCALVLLFFAISLTDDLHEVPAVAESTRSSRRTLQISKGGASDGDSDKHSALLAEAPVARIFVPVRAAVGWLVAAAAPSPLAVPNRPFQGRAPPS